MRYKMFIGAVTDTKLFNRTGDVGRWAEKVNVAFTRHAIARAPSSLESGRPNKSRANAAYPSGSMKRNIHGGVQRVGPRQLQTIIVVDVPYALYVIKGTPAWIYGKSSIRGEGGRFVTIDEGRGMYLPGQPRWPQRYRQRVRGQRANNFLGDAFDATARTHSSLRGYSMIG